MKFRKPVELGERINKRWLGYAAAGAAGVGMLATVQPAQADIIYTSSNTPLGTATIDFGSGLADFEFSNARHYYGGFLRAYRVGSGIGFLSDGNPLGKGAVIGSSGKFVSAPPFQFGQGTLAFRFKLYGIHTVLYSGGPWFDVSDRYLGLQFFLDGSPHFGWAELSVRPDGGESLSATLVSYAYNTVPNEAITAGQGQTPEPGTLGLLALGSLGLGFWRRRKAPMVEDRP